MMWGVFCSAGTGMWEDVGKMDEVKCRRALGRKLLDVAKYLRRRMRFTLQQDNSPKRRVKVTVKWLESKHIDVLECSSQSSDLFLTNVIHPVWLFWAGRYTPWRSCSCRFYSYKLNRFRNEKHFSYSETDWLCTSSRTTLHIFSLWQNTGWGLPKTSPMKCHSKIVGLNFKNHLMKMADCSFIMKRHLVSTVVGTHRVLWTVTFRPRIQQTTRRD